MGQMFGGAADALCLLSSRIWGLKQKKIYKSTESKGYEHWGMSNNLKACGTGISSKMQKLTAKKEK